MREKRSKFVSGDSVPVSFKKSFLLERDRPFGGSAQYYNSLQKGDIDSKSSKDRTSHPATPFCTLFFEFFFCKNNFHLGFSA